MTPQPPARRLSSLQIVVSGLFASPAAAAWLAGSELAAAGRRRSGRALALSGAALSLIVLAALLLAPLRWAVAAIVWFGFCVAASTALAAWLRGAVGEPPPQAPRDARVRETLRALVLVVCLMPPLVLFSHLVVSATLGRLLVRMDPTLTAPTAAIGALFWGVLWGIPSGLLFVFFSLRRGRLDGPADVGRAALSFLWLMLVIEVFVSGAIRGVRSLMFGAELYSETGALQEFLAQWLLYIAAVPLALGLAWGPGHGARRLLRCSGLLLAGLVNLSVVLGLVPSVQFVAARQIEKSGRVDAALGWYAQALSSRSTPLIESYLQHRIGLLNYKLGKEEQAMTSFQLVQTTRNANPELVRQSAYYLERLAHPSDGERVVLEGVEVNTELRSSYCAPNTLALVFNFWGQPLSPAEIGEQVALVGGGTKLSSIQFLVEQRGLEHMVVPFATVEDLRWIVDRGLPVLAYIPGHVLAVFGYDTRLDTLVTYDTATWDIWVDEPRPDFVEKWAGTSFMMGIVLPEGDAPAGVDEVRQRYRHRASRAAWHWYLSLESGSREESVRQLKAALGEDPTFYPAAFDLLNISPAHKEWLDRQADDGLLTTLALREMDRDPAPTDGTAADLAHWLGVHERWEEVLDFADRLERRGRLNEVRQEAGLAAAKLGRWERAVFLLDDEDLDEDDAMLWQLARAHQALGQAPAALRAAQEVIATSRRDVLDEAMALVEREGQDRGPVFMAEALDNYLIDRRFDPARQQRLAEEHLAAAETTGGKDRHRHLHLARRAALMAIALARDEAERERARDLLSRAEQSRGLGGREGTSAPEPESR